MEDYTETPDGRLLKVYPPKDAEDKTTVDVIAIHGLGTTTPRTWEYKNETGVVNWLSDSNMLPDVVPSARIYTFSWNANYSKDAPVTRITNVAEVLLSNLERNRNENTLSRPLVFVASCFGGLVVVKALEIANVHESAYRKILVATSGIVFLGCPLQGTRAGKAAQWHVMISGILGKYPSQTLLEDLDGSRKALRETTDHFVSMIKTPPMQIRTMCFWETRRSQVLKAVIPHYLPRRVLRRINRTEIILVEEDSATILGHDQMPLDASHSMMNKFHGPSDANFGLVSSAIKEMVETALKIALSQREAHRLHNEHFMVSRRPNPLFTGRERELKNLKQALCPSLLTSNHTIGPKVYVIYGMGGAGKSEIAVKFAHENRSAFWGIFWIDGRSKSSITNGFTAIARQCGCQNESLEGGMMWLQNSTHSWLLILDNADNEDLKMANFLPAGRNGSILMTTRLTECANYQTVGKDHYERLNQDTAIDLLLKTCEIEMSTRSEHESDARVIVDLLGCHALAVIQAGSAISQGLCNLAKYSGIFRHQRQDLLEWSPKQANTEYGGVYATFEVTAKYLEDRRDQVAKDALQLLNFYACMHFSNFPEAAFEEAWKNSTDEDVISSDLLPDGEENIRKLAPWHISHLPTFMQKVRHNNDLNTLRIHKARSLLDSLSLVTFDSARGMTRMHPVTHFWSRDRLREPESSTNAKLNGFAMLSLSIRDPYNIDPMPISIQLQSHIESIAQSLKEWNDPLQNLYFQQAIFRLGYVLYCLGYDSALSVLLGMIPLKEDVIWMGSQNGQNIQLLHGRYMLDHGDAKEAVLVLERLHKVHLEMLNAEDPNIRASRHGLARAYLMTGDTTKAITLFEQICRTESESLSSESDNLVSLHELAGAYLEIGDTTKAIKLLEKNVKTEAQTLRPENSNRLASRHQLARAYLEVDETEKAIALLEEVVDIKARTLRPEHPSRLTSQHVLARAYLAMNKTDKAIALLKEVLNIRIRTLSPENTDRLKSQHHLARAYLEVNETDKAIALFEEVLDIRRGTLGPEHPDRLASQHELARAYLEVNEIDKAIALLEEVVGIRTRTLRPEHHDRLTSQHVLATAYLDANKTDKAIVLLESVVEIRKRTLRGDHPDLVRSIYVLAQCHYHAQNYERALELTRSIEGVAQNRGREMIADWTAEGISLILEKMDVEEEDDGEGDEENEEDEEDEYDEEEREEQDKNA